MKYCVVVVVVVVVFVVAAAVVVKANKITQNKYLMKNYTIHLYTSMQKLKKVIPLQARCGPEGG